MKKKGILKVLATCAMACTLCFAGCGEKPDTELSQSWTLASAYVQAQSQGFTGTFDEFMQYLTNIGDITVNNQGNLVFTLGDGTVIDAGKVAGAQGIQGIQGVQGEQGKVGRTGFVVNTVAELEAAVKVPNSYVALAGNLAVEEEITINAEADMDFVLDLNGYTISNVNTAHVGNLIAVRTRYSGKQVENVTINGVIRNGKVVSTTETASQSDWAVVAIGNNINLTLEDLEISAASTALSTNGYGQVGSLTATDCTFTSTSTDPSVGLAAYLPANYDYTFTNCEFEGSAGIYTKSGRHVYTNCEITATGDAGELTYAGSAGNHTGAGITIDSADGYSSTPKMSITFTNCDITSANGFGILEGTTVKNAGNTPYSYLEALVIDAETTITGTLGATSIETIFNA